MSEITIRSSRMVNPSFVRRSTTGSAALGVPVADVGVLALAALHLVRPEREDVEARLVAGARRRVLIRRTPRIQQVGALDVALRGIAARHGLGRRGGHQRGETLLVRGVAPVVELVELERLLELGELDAREVELGLVA